MPFATITLSTGQQLPFTIVTGDVPQPLQETVKEKTRAGVHGHAYRMEGRRSEPFEISAGRDHANAIEAALFVRSLRDAVGQMVSYTDTQGIVFEHVMLLHVRREGPMNNILSAAGQKITPGIPTIWQKFRITMQLTVVGNNN